MYGNTTSPYLSRSYLWFTYKKAKADNTYPASADSHASWLKKGGKDPYGYKKPSITDQEGLVLGVVTKARTNEVSNLEEVFDSANLPERIPVKADKGYPITKKCWTP